MPLAKRLFIAFLLMVLVGVVCWGVLPRYGLWAPVEVVILGYFVILGACVLVAAPGENQADEDDPGVTDDPAAGDHPQPPERPIAGRIGPGS